MPLPGARRNHAAQRGIVVRTTTRPGPPPFRVLGTEVMRRGWKVGSVRAAVRQAGLLLSLSVLLVTQLAAMGHLVFVRHSLCEHGAAVHDDHHRVATAAHIRTGAEPAVRPGEPSEGSHEHCDPAGIMPALVQATTYSLPPTLLDGYLLPFSVRPSTGEAPTSILDFAPKSSPPV